MAAKSKLPIWLWWVLSLAAIAAAIGAVLWLVGIQKPILPQELVEKRAVVARILEDSNRTEDVDIKPLVALETAKDYKGAVALLAQALTVNARHEELNAELVAVSEGLTKLALDVEPDEIGARAVEAFGALAQLAAAEKTFFQNRRQLYEMTRNYYTDLAAKKKTAIPAGLRPLVETVNADLNRAKVLHQQFAASVKAFDEAVAGR